MMQISPVRTGWLCPKCSSAHSPDTNTCPTHVIPPQQIPYPHLNPPIYGPNVMPVTCTLTTSAPAMGNGSINLGGQHLIVGKFPFSSNT